MYFCLGLEWWFRYLRLGCNSWHEVAAKVWVSWRSCSLILQDWGEESIFGWKFLLLSNYFVRPVQEFLILSFRLLGLGAVEVCLTHPKLMVSGSWMTILVSEDFVEVFYDVLWLRLFWHVTSLCDLFSTVLVNFHEILLSLRHLVTVSFTFACKILGCSFQRLQLFKMALSCAVEGFCLCLLPWF